MQDDFYAGKFDSGTQKTFDALYRRICAIYSVDPDGVDDFTYDPGYNNGTVFPNEPVPAKGKEPSFWEVIVIKLSFWEIIVIIITVLVALRLIGKLFSAIGSNSGNGGCGCGCLPAFLLGTRVGSSNRRGPWPGGFHGGPRPGGGSRPSGGFTGGGGRSRGGGGGFHGGGGSGGGFKGGGGGSRGGGADFGRK